MTNYEQGRYIARIVGQGFGESGDRGTPYFYLRINPESYFDRRSEGTVPCPVAERTLYFYISEAAAPYTVQNLRKLGFNGSSFRQLDPDVDGFFSLVDRTIEVFCDHDEYKGKVKEKWSLALPQQEHKKIDVEARVGRYDACFEQFPANGQTEFPPMGANAPKEFMPTGEEIPF